MGANTSCKGGCQGGCVEIPLVKGRGVMRCSREDYEVLSTKRWSLHSQGYAKTRVHRTLIYAHRMIMSAKQGELVDHRDGDRLHNCRGNLRIATSRQNLANRGPQKNNKSGYKGVWPRNQQYGQSFAAQLKHEKHIWLGTYKTPEEAALAYNRAAQEVWGEFAWLNDVPDEGDESEGCE